MRKSIEFNESQSILVAEEPYQGIQIGLFDGDDEICFILDNHTALLLAKALLSAVQEQLLVPRDD